MKTVDMPLHELATIAATRAMAGAGLALVVTEQVPKEQRKAVGWTLLAIGFPSNYHLCGWYMDGKPALQDLPEARKRNGSA